MKEKFLEIVRQNIKRDGIENFLSWLEKSDFFRAPASTKYHLCCDGGLLQHSLGVYECLKNVLSSNSIAEYSDETIALVALTHDICKCNFYKKGFRNVKDEETGQWEKKEIYEVDDKLPLGHGEKSVIMLQAFMKLTVDEIYAIRWHMSGFDNAVKGGEYALNTAYQKCKLAVALHLADMEATYFLEN